MYAQIGSVLTAIYWAVAALGAWLADPGPGAWIDFRWVIAFLFYAFPSTLILWTTKQQDVATPLRRLRSRGTTARLEFAHAALAPAVFLRNRARNAH